MDESELTVPEAAKRYGISPRSIQRLYARGLLALDKRVGERATLVRPQDLERALAQRRGPGRPRRASRLKTALQGDVPPLVALFDELRTRSRGLDGCAADLVRESHEDHHAGW